jgi:pimeloyl-[acyl-carrier protein] synthase
MENIKWNPYNKSFKENPYAFYDFFREKKPIHRAVGNQWFVSRYEDVKEVLRNPAFLTVDIGSSIFSKSKFNRESNDFMGIAQNSDFWFMFMNDNLHKEIRGVVAKHWNDTTLENLIEESIDLVLQDLNPNQEIDFSKTITETISAHVMCKLLGLPYEDKDYLLEVSHTLLQVVEPFNNLYAINHQNDVIIAFQAYLTKIVAEKKSNPEQDLISKLTAFSDFTDPQIVSVTMLLVFTGMESSSYFLSTGFLHLLENPEEWKKLRTEKVSITTAIEELIRHVSITKLVFRVAESDQMIGNTLIEKNETIILSLESANFDETIFKDPKIMDLSRKPNPHLAFGYGFHACLGAKLARMEGQMLFSKLAKLPFEYQLIPEKTIKRKNILIGGVSNLYIKTLRK